MFSLMDLPFSYRRRKARRDLAIEPRQSTFSSRHVALTAVLNRGGDGLRIAAIDPELVGKVWRARLRAATSVVAMTGGTIGREDCLAGLYLLGRHVLRRGRLDANVRT